MAYDRNPLPHRQLKLGDQGTDVKLLQAAVNLRLKRKKALTRVTVDGEYGAHTEIAYGRSAYLIGLPHNKPTPGCQAITRNPALRTPSMIARSARNVAEWRARARGTAGERAVRWLGHYVGKVETGYNDAPWLRAWEASLPHHRLDWMIPGNPYCGFACVVSSWNGARQLLPDDTVSTEAIVERARRGDGYKIIPFSQGRAGDMPVFNFGSGGPKHVGRLREPIRNGIAKTREANTSPGTGGSQSNGGGVWDRSRPTGFILVLVRPL